MKPSQTDTLERSAPKFRFEDRFDHLVTVAMVFRVPSSRAAEVLERVAALPDVRLIYSRLSGSRRLWISETPREGRQ